MEVVPARKAASESSWFAQASDPRGDGPTPWPSDGGEPRSQRDCAVPLSGGIRGGLIGGVDPVGREIRKAFCFPSKGYGAPRRVSGVFLFQSMSVRRAPAWSLWKRS